MTTPRTPHCPPTGFASTPFPVMAHLPSAVAWPPLACVRPPPPQDPPHLPKKMAPAAGESSAAGPPIDAPAPTSADPPGCCRIQPHWRWIHHRSHPDVGLSSPPQPSEAPRLRPAAREGGKGGLAAAILAIARASGGALRQQRDGEREVEEAVARGRDSTRFSRGGRRGGRRLTLFNSIPSKLLIQLLQ